VDVQKGSPTSNLPPRYGKPNAGVNAVFMQVVLPQTKTQLDPDPKTCRATGVGVDSHGEE